MKEKHVKSYIEQCLIIAKLSPCVRRRYGAIAVDPKHNVIIVSGYNGTPRGSNEPLCGGVLCRRDGLKPEDRDNLKVVDGGFRGHRVDFVNRQAGTQTLLNKPNLFTERSVIKDEELKDEAMALYPPITSGERYEVGCHHAEANVVTNAARLGRSLAGAWVFCSGTPCEGCARLLHHAGVVKVLTIRGGYSGASGRPYLEEHGVAVVEVEAPVDLRAEVEAAMEDIDRDVPVGEGQHDYEEGRATGARRAIERLQVALDRAGPGAGPAVDPRK